MRSVLSRMAAGWLCFVLWTSASAGAADSLSWQSRSNRVSADITGGKLPDLLEQVAAATGWQVFVEPDTTHSVSAKFSNLPSGEALRLLLGDLNFALVPETNSGSKLFVFRTMMRNATQRIWAKVSDTAGKSRLIANELLVRLKPGAKIEDIAKALGAKVVGRIDSLDAYRLQFEDAAAADAARQQLNSNPDVAAVDNNYMIDRPTGPAGLQSTELPGPPQLQLKPLPANGRIIIGLVDTEVQTLGNGLDQFLLKQLSVAGDPELDPHVPSHGTSMAETMLRALQSITGGNSSVQILPVNAFGANNYTTSFEVGSAIITAVNGGATLVNLSLASPDDSAFLRGIIQEVSRQNIPLIAAAGNEPVATPVFPAAYPEVKAVTAVDNGQLASYANRGTFVSLGAPGTSIVYFNGQPWVVTGTSAASAFTSGLAAGYLDAKKNNNTDMLKFLDTTMGVKIAYPK